MLGNIAFANPYFLLLLLGLIPLWGWRKQQKHTYEVALTLPSLKTIRGFGNLRTRLRPWLFVLQLAALGLLIVALARPQSRFAEQKVNAEGIDIIISTDISGSMFARDFQPDRLGAAKDVAREFVQNRPYDRIGLVAFAAESFTQCPATTDHRVVLESLDGLKSGIVEDGTAIGMGLATAVTRLQDSNAKSKIIILLTDGVNNAGFIDPLTAAETARQYNIKVYAIGVGTTGKAPFPVQSLFGVSYQYMDVKIDEDLLQKIATATGGKYFRATDNESLRKIYAEIDKMEKTKIETTTISRYSELFYPFVWAALLCLLLDIGLRQTVFRGI